MRTGPRTLAAAAMANLVGCVGVGPAYTPPQPELPAAWSNLGNGVTPNATVDLARWWTRFDDPLLGQLIEEALHASPDLASVRTRLREARARRTVAAAARLPSVSASAAASRSHTSEEVGRGTTTELYSAGFDAAWEVDVFGGVRRSVDAAEADLEASIESVRDAQVTLAAEVARTYIEVRGLQRRLAIARENLVTQDETLELTAWRAEAGLVSSQDVDQARTNVEQTRALIPALEISLAAVAHALDVLLGQAPGGARARLAEEVALPPVPAAIAVGIPADALRQRPDVRAAERTLAAETARVGVAQAARYPAFNLAGSVGVEALSASALGNSGAWAASLFAGIVAPIFDGGRLRAQVEIQDAVRERAEIAYRQAVLGALEDVENALVALVQTREREAALERAADAAQSAAALGRQRYSAGLVDFQSVLDSERSVLTIEDSLAATRTDGVLALIRLYKALGGGWSSESTLAREDAR